MSGKYELNRETLDGTFEETSHKLTVLEVAAGSVTTRKTLSTIINGRQRVTPEISVRLGVAFANTTPGFWLTVQDNYDLAQARRKVDTIDVKVLWKPLGLFPQLETH